MHFHNGLVVIDPADTDYVADEARRAGLRVYKLNTGDGGGREAFFEAVATLPLDPPVRSSRSWDALADSIWEGLRRLSDHRIAIIWLDATDFRRLAEVDFEVANFILRDLSESLADPRMTCKASKKVSIFIGIAVSDENDRR